ncbi:MAG: AMP-binding protein [Chloroflexota bacterium]
MDNRTKLPPEQETIRARCIHPSGTYVEFSLADVETSIPARFEKIVRLYSDRIAVKSIHEQLSYSELNHAANRVARVVLDRCGEGQEPVGFLLPKGAPFVIALLGILKAGKIAAPLDPAFPSARLSLMFEDMQARLLVTDHEGFALADGLAGSERCLNISELGTNRVEESPDISISPDAFACLFYTSGSTGSPKGVIENHRNLLHNTMRDTNDYQICAEDKVTFVASSGRDIFRALLNGAAIFPMDIRREGSAGFARWLMEQKITVYNSVTSAFRNFAGTLRGHERFPHLRLIMVTGESVYRSDFELYQKHFSNEGCVFVNRYGPNEASGVISQYLMNKSTEITGSVVPVGYAATGKEIQLIDESGNPVDVGQPGEIVVTSPYLSPGYWRQPDRSREAFRVSSLENKSRVYHTGDMGMMSPDRCLTHLGRKDDQVKIRGNKVQIAAVETVLLNQGNIREAAVVALENDTGDKRLVAYIVARAQPAPTSSELRESLKASIPDFMIPSAFVVLDKLPVTGIGKVDRRLLAAPSKDRPQLRVSYVAPRNVHEAKLAAIWAEVLELVEVGVLDNFFDLGGHSLTASRVISEVIQAFELELPIKALFDAPTIAEMAAIITQTQAKPASESELAQMLQEVEAMTEAEAHRRMDKINSTIANK